jgi:hypothetical protein
MKKPKFLRDLDQMGRDSFVDAAQKPRIVTCPQGVVAYTIGKDKKPSPGAMLQQVFNPEETDARIREILASNPDVDLTEDTLIQKALGVRILAHKKTKRPPPSTDEDIFW